MNIQDVKKLRDQYLSHCQFQKQLSSKTLKAYQIDLNQFCMFAETHAEPLCKGTLLAFFEHLHEVYKPKTAKRKIASLKAFFAYLEYEELIEGNPLQRIQTKFREPFCLPRTIPIEHIQQMLNAVYGALREQGITEYKSKTLLRDIAVIELLFASGMRVSELCALRREDVSLHDGTIKIYGKGAKERLIQIGNPDVLLCLKSYSNAFSEEIASTECFFINRLGKQLAEQSVRAMIKKYASACGLSERITPHMFRHSFASLLLEEDVDIRYIQRMLGHSSIVTTQIYTHVSAKKQRDILTNKHPRNHLTINTR